MNFVDELSTALRYALRTFRREPGFVAGVVLTFALAIGANAAMFGLVDRLMLAAPPGVRDAARVVKVSLAYGTDDGNSFAMSTMSYPAFQAISQLPNAFSDVAAVRTDSVKVGRGAELREVAAVKASGAYFSALGATPARGRFFGPTDDALPSGSAVAVLSYAYWQRQFGGADGALGSTVVVEGEPFVVIGVAAREFNGDGLGAVELFLPLSAASRGESPGWWNEPRRNIVSVVARLRADVSAPSASAMVTSALRADGNARIGSQLASTSLESLLPGKSARETAQSKIALWLSGVALVVLLIATANVGTLLLLRAARRRRDTAVRITLGAGAARLAWAALIESLLLALAGGVVGVLLSRWFGDVVRATLLPSLAPTERLANGPVLVASLAAALGAGILAGLSPLVQLRRRNLSSELRAGGGHGASGRFVLQHALVATQVALCTVLLVGAGLFVRSLQRVQSQDLGFSTARLLYVNLDFRGQPSAVERDAAHEEAVRRLRTLRGVSGATAVQGMPFASHHIPPISVPEAPNLIGPGVQPPIMYGATPEYLEMMGVTLREGRLLNARDVRGAPLVVLVNETMARNAWPDGSAIGKCVKAGFGANFTFDQDPMESVAAAPCREVVGVVRDSRARSLRTEGNEARLMQYYVPISQAPAAPMPNIPEIHGILVRTTAADPARLAAVVQRAIQDSAATPVFAKVRPYQQLIDPQLRSWRLGATLFTAFGALALGIASLGLVAVVSYLVSQRTQEIGVRLALGGTRLRIGRLVVLGAMRTALAGAAAGLVIAMVAAPSLQSMLFETRAREPVSALGAAGLLLVVAAGASMLPAWRASRVSPMTALRAES